MISLSRFLGAELTYFLPVFLLKERNHTSLSVYFLYVRFLETNKPQPPTALECCSCVLDWDFVHCVVFTCTNCSKEQ